MCSEAGLEVGLYDGAGLAVAWGGETIDGDDWPRACVSWVGGSVSVLATGLALAEAGRRPRFLTCRL